MRLLHLLTLSLLVAAPAFAQKMKTVSGEYSYVVPTNVTQEEAERIALEKAKIQALADEFGTIVSQDNYTTIKDSNVSFLSLGQSEVKGEWIETIGKPVYSRNYENDVLIITVKVKGRAREIVSASVDLSTRILRNGTTDKYESDSFKNGDDMYVSFSSPVAGFVCIYLLDDDNHAYCLLPYRNQKEGIYRTVANRKYLFFNTSAAEPAEKSCVDEYTLTCSRTSEHNQIYIIFSPNSFTKAADSNSGSLLPQELGNEDFLRWLADCRKKDPAMSVKTKLITIEK